VRVLVTGGSGVVGEAAVRALLGRGHAVRLLARHADDDARVWPATPGGGVEPYTGDVTDAASLRGAADGCEAVLHLVGSVEGDADALRRLNVDGTRHVVDEAARAGAARFVYVSSLGADRGASDYHKTKFAGESEARRFPRGWTIVRPGNVYGPGDQQISLLLRMVRALPAIPMPGGGDEEFQPVWADDAGEALARACERDDLAGQVLEVAGDERTCMRDLLDRFAALTGRKPVRVPVPGALATLGVRLADLAGVDLGINAGQLTMVAEGNVVADPAGNALTRVFGVPATPLETGLRRLLDALPEQLPEEGLGALHARSASRSRCSTARPTRSTGWRWRCWATSCSAPTGSASSSAWSRTAAGGLRRAYRSRSARWRTTTPSAWSGGWPSWRSRASAPRTRRRWAWRTCPRPTGRSRRRSAGAYAPSGRYAQCSPQPSRYRLRANQR
jgi:NADH dehydrogenase